MSLGRKRSMNVNVWHKNENINKNTDCVYTDVPSNTTPGGATI